MYGAARFSTLGLALPLQNPGIAGSPASAAFIVGGSVVVAGIILMAIWFAMRRRLAGRLLEEAKARAATLSEGAERDAESVLKEAKIDAREEHLKARQTFEDESRDRRRELGRLEKRIARREEKPSMFSA